MILQMIYLIIPAGDKIWAFFFLKEKIVKVGSEKENFSNNYGQQLSSPKHLIGCYIQSVCLGNNF